jgi:hypothetical protein
MQIFKKEHRSRSLILLVGLSLLSGCLKPRQKDEVDEALLRHHQTQMNASFYVGRAITGTSYDHDSVSGWGLPETKFYNFRACLTDRVTNDRIIGHRFEVLTLGAQGEGQLSTTDDEGCLQWSETIPFNYFSYEAKYLTLRREIRGIGIHTGSYIVDLAINPWRSSRGGNSPEIIDLARSSIPESQLLDPQRSNQFISAQFQRKVPVEVKDLSVNIQARQARASGSEIEVHLTMGPQVVFENIFGERVVQRIRQGEFDVYFQIVATSTRQDKSDLLVVSDPMTASMSDKNADDRTVIRFQDDRIDVQFVSTLRNQVTNGHYDLVLRLVPRGMPGLQEFFGVYRFNEHHSLLSSRGGMRPILSSIDNQRETRNFENKLDQAKRDMGMLAGGDVRQLDPFSFDYMDVRFMRVMPDETTTERTITYRAETCIRRSLDRRHVLYEEFQILKDDGTTATANTEQAGCISWIDSITHKYYQPEEIKVKTVTITHPSSGFQKELSAYINPWDYGWTFGQDSRRLPPEYIDEVNNRDPVISQLFIPGYGYETIRFRYEIDKFLNLNVKKTLLLDVSPRVLRYGSITRGRNATESLRDGVYLMKVAVQKDYYDPRTPGLNLKSHPDIAGSIMLENSHNKEVEFIDAVQKLVRVRHGRIVTPIEFSVNDLRLMRVRSNFLIEISAVDERQLGITPNMSMSSLDVAALVASTDGLSDLARTNPRMAEVNPHNVRGNYVVQDQYFTDAPFEILNHEVAEALRDDQQVQRRARSLDLDQFIDRNSGLPTRTFVGPIIMLSNNWGAGLRPTDDLEEISDCDNLSVEDRKICEETQQDKASHLTFDNDPLVARFYGSTRHLENTSVTQLMERAYANRLEYENQQTYESLISKYVDGFLLDYVSLTHTPLKVLPMAEQAIKVITQDDEITSFTELARHLCGSDYLEDCLEDDQRESAITKEDLLTQLNFQDLFPWSNYHGYRRFPQFTARDLKNFIRTGQADEFMGHRLCHMWTYHMMGDRHGFNVREQSRIFRSSFRNLFLASPLETWQFAHAACIREVRSKGIDSVFTVARMLKPNKVEGYRFKGGKSLNFNVGSSFSLNFGESLSTSMSTTFDPKDLVAKIPVVGKFLGGVLGVFSIKQGNSASQSRSLGLGTSVNSGTYLAMQRAAMDLYFDEYEPCMEIRMRTKHLATGTMLRLINHLPEDKRYQAATRGLFICTGDKVRERVPFQENYYYFTQHFTEGDMLDNGDLLNHPWLLALRGERSYSHFIELIQATPQTDRRSRDFDLRWLPNHMLKHYLDHGDDVMNIPGSVNLGDRPLDQLIEAYNMMPPTFPGLYTVRPQRLDYPR